MADKGIRPVTYIHHGSGPAHTVHGFVVEEIPMCIHINGERWVTLMCSPHALDDLVLGFLRSEGLIADITDVAELVVAPNDRCVDVWLSSPPTTLPRRHTITSGCGGGITFEDIRSYIPPVTDQRSVPAEALMRLMGQLKRATHLYRRARGIHGSALSDGRELLLIAEDVGRHNTIDRLWGQAMRRHMSTAGHILLTTGRISSEMLRKAAKMQVPIIASRTSPTSLSLELAHAWHITVVGYVRRNSLRVYTWPERIEGANAG